MNKVNELIDRLKVFYASTEGHSIAFEAAYMLESQAMTMEQLERDKAELVEALRHLYGCVVYDEGHEKAYTKAAKIISKHTPPLKESENE